MTWLFNRQTGLYEPAELLDRIETVDIACYQEHWQPPMRAKIDELKAANQYNRATVSACNLEDAHWQWPKKCQERIGQLEWISAAIRCAGKTQGLMYASLVQQCRLPGLHKKHLVYIDLVSTAPWNRPRLNQNPLYGGVGLVLVTEAILISQQQEFEGRVGLHSLPGAEKLYREKFGMECLGPDPKYHGLLYFELTAQRAAQLLASNKT